jgi:TonB-linked SusC/RagA family outer membrane protein
VKRCRLAWVVALTLWSAAGPGRAQAQRGESGAASLAQRGPVFYAVSSTGVRMDARNAEVLRARIALALHSASVPDALDTIAVRSGLAINYSRSLMPSEQRVTLVATEITVAAALSAILMDAGLDVQMTGERRATLVAHEGTAVRPTTGIVPMSQQGVRLVGRVTDARTLTGVGQATVHIEGTPLGAIADADGRYAIAGVAPGNHGVIARRVGYSALTQTITIRGDSGIAHLDFALTATPTKLDEIVTTAIGDQRRYQVGNVISTINVDSIASTAPVTSITDILASRAPGLEVVETGGLTGSGEAIRIRGQSSMALQSDPIVIVDGVRQDNSPGGSYNLLVGVVPTPNRLNDIDFSQVATIDVLKGPAASTEYGTDAASGVIVITTKRGISGKAQWHASAEEGLNDIPTGFPDYYYSWGHRTGGSNAATECPLVRSSHRPQSTNGTCVVDSVTHYNPLNHSATSIYGVGTRGKYDLDVSGGTDRIRYFLAGGLTNETGALRLPPVFVPQAQASGFPGSVLNPNGEQQRSGRANTFLRLGSTADISLNVAYLSTFQTVPSLNGGGLFAGANAGSPPDSANNYGWGRGPIKPLIAVGTLTSQQTDRFTGGLSWNWRPTPWLVGFADAGIDHGSQRSQVTRLPQVLSYLGAGPDNGQYSLGQVGTDIYSADLRVAATVTLTRTLKAVTTFGLNLRDSRSSGLTSYATGLSTANLNLAGAVNPSVNQLGARSATLGGYGEEQLQVADRLFVTGALRVDAASGFGYSYQTATYPKLSASWLAVQQGQTTVRLRGAFGAAGVAPYNGLALQLYNPVVVAATGGLATAVQLQQPGNPNLKPEYTEEWEGGVDIGLWGNRMSIELSAYSKTTQDALYSEALGWDLGGAPYEINIGEIRNRGLEGQITVIPVQSGPLIWTATVNASVNSNLLVHLAPGLTPLNLGAQQIAPGYPLYGFWGNKEHYADVNHDGIIEPSEVTVDRTETYLGSSLPTQQASFDTRIAVLNGTLSVGALFTYQGGYRVFNAFAQSGAANGTLPEQNIAESPLWQQARAVAYTTNAYGYYASGYFEDGTVLRFQELSLTYALPGQFAHVAHVHSLSLTGAIRNLAYWTRYSGGDPSASYANGQNYQPSANTSTVNNDLRTSGASAVPLARYFQFRLNVGF